MPENYIRKFVSIHHKNCLIDFQLIQFLVIVKDESPLGCGKTLEFKEMELTESTDDTSETMIMMIEVLKRKIGTPHCNGYGIRTQAEAFHASETSVRQCFMVYPCFMHALTKILELGT